MNQSTPLFSRDAAPARSPFRRVSAPALAACVALCAPTAPNQDPPRRSDATAEATSLSDAWPQYAGPRHDRSAPGPIGLRDWPESGPPVAWTVPTPLGFSSFAVAGDRAFTLVARARREVCVALDAASGTELWATALSPTSYDDGGDRGAPDNTGGDGPRSTPAHDGGRVYAFDAALVLHCLDASDGKKLWQRDLVAQHEGRNVRWQNAASPLLDGERVFVAGGGAGQSLIAVDKRTGEVLWQKHDETITHATPIVAEIHGVRQVIFFVRSGLVAVAPESGELLWHIAYPFSTSSAASPVVLDDIVYCSAGYGVGAAAYRIVKTDEDGFAHELLWRKRNRLMNHWSTPVAKDGHLYGMFSFKEYGTGPLMCVELESGDTRWSVEGFGPGNCIRVGEDLVALSDRGEVVLVAAEPGEYEELARADVLRGKCWSSPAFAGGRLYVRSTVEGACIDLR